MTEENFTEAQKAILDVMTKDNSFKEALIDSIRKPPIDLYPEINGKMTPIIDLILMK